MSGKILNTEVLYKIIYNLTKEANLNLPLSVYEKIKSADIEENLKAQILQNAYLANKTERPLCQDCGQVVVFIDIGQNITLCGEYIEDVINKAIENCYKDNFLRKSVVKDALRNRENTNTNTPCIIHSRIIRGNKINILLTLKGGGAENTTRIKMFNPTADKKEIFEFVKETATQASLFACPPLFVGLGAGGTLETACLLAKKALFEGENIPLNIENVLEVKMLTAPTHIANLPVCVNINCHASRFKKATIEFKGNNFNISYEKDNFVPSKIKHEEKRIRINTKDKEEFEKLKKGNKISLTGTIYTARDMAHKRLVEIIKKGEKLPFELSSSIIFYAGPAPKKEGEIIGPTGPTTSKRMDKFAEILYKKGVLATIGKGERTKNFGPYLTATGGVACLLQKCVKKCELIAFKDLGAEAVFKLEVKDMPLTVNYV